MSDTLDVLSLAEAKTAINLPAANTDHDTELAQHITAVSRVLDKSCGPVVQRTVTAEIHDARWGVWLRQAPVASITLVRTASGGTIETLTAVGFGATTDGYSIDPAISGRLLRAYGGSESSWGSGQVEVTYVAGRYANTAAVDARFKTCAGSVLRRLWKRESGTWAQSSDFLASLEGGDTTSVGFFRVAKPIIDEMLWDELVLPGIA